MSRFDNASPWYLNAVPFNPKATAPTCQADVLCFDSTRFLLGDFEGNGRADLMVITPRKDGTAFWLMKSTGTHFDTPRLWYRPVRAGRRISRSNTSRATSTVTATS